MQTGFATSISCTTLTRCTVDLSGEMFHDARNFHLLSPHPNISTRTPTYIWERISSTTLRLSLHQHVFFFLIIIERTFHKLLVFS